MNIYYNKRFQILLKRLAAVDSTLEKLGTPKIYHKLRTYVIRVLISWLVFIKLSIIIDILMWWNAIKDCRFFILLYITNHHIYVNMLIDLFFVIFLWYIGTRFDKINEHMTYLLVRKEYGLIWRKTVLTIHRNIKCANYYKYVLWTSMHLHLELCQIAREFNRIFGLQITIEMINCMICFIKYCWYIHIHVRTKSFSIISLFQWFHIQTWLYLYGIRLFGLNYACESVSTKANKMERIIHQLTDFLQYANDRDEIYQFILQIIYHPLKFTGLGLFYFGNGLLRRVIMGLITFIIIIIQVATTPRSIQQYIKKKLAYLQAR